jgi:ABC-type nitrate/sulfonate/bicarbonate transport system substrate-binding protein
LDRRILSIVLISIVLVGVGGVYWYWSLMTKKPFTLRFGCMPFADSAPLYVADEKGFFRDENLNVTLTNFFKADLMINTVTQGSLDGGQTTLFSLLLAFQAGADFKIMGYGSYDDENHDTNALLVRVDSPIQSIKDLKGKIVANQNTGAMFQLCMQVILSRYNMTLDDIHLRAIPIMNMPDALLGGVVDCANVAEPYLTPALETGKFRILSRSYTEVFPDHRFPFQVVFFSKRFIDENKDIVNAFLRAFGKAVDWINGHLQETKEIIANRTGIDVELARKMSLTVVTKGLQPELYEQLINLMLEYNTISGLEKNIKIEDITYQD